MASNLEYRWTSLMSVVVEFLKLRRKVEMTGDWSTNASTTLFFFFLIPKTTTGERLAALLLTMIRWWEWLRFPSVVEWMRTMLWRGMHDPKWLVQRSGAGWKSLLAVEAFDFRRWKDGQRCFGYLRT